MKNRFLWIVWLFVCKSVFSQVYQREIQIVSDETKWKYIPIPEQMYVFTKVSEKNIRIKNVNQGVITEIPFILSDNLREGQNLEVLGELRNKSLTKEGYYYTIYNDKKQVSQINEIQLYFGNSNFDWKINLEGSHDGQKWFTLLEEYRISKIENEQVSYSFEKLRFGTSDYPFYRLYIPQGVSPELDKAVLGYYKPKADTNARAFLLENVFQDTQRKETIIDFKVEQPFPVYAFKVYMPKDNFFSRSFDLYRVIEEGNQTKYQRIFSEMLRSDADNYFVLGRYLVGSNFRIVIDNKDNLPIIPTKIEAQVYQQGIIFDAKLSGAYKLEYNGDYGYPSYDLDYFRAEILNQKLDTVSLGEQQNIGTDAAEDDNTIVKQSNQYWIWVLMLVIIMGLGYFSLKMLKDKEKN